MKKILGLFLAVGMAASTAFAAITVKKSGPVSYYGKLQAKNSKLYAAKTQAPVQLKGMSMFWDTWDVGYDFYRADVVDSLVSKWKIEIIRVAHGTASNRNANWENLDKAVIEAAIKNDIYVIIDFHSHSAHNEVDEAKDFFKKMASAYGSYPNVIFEIYNEPMSSTGGNWNNVKNYADVIMPHIRQNGGTDNLIVVGNDGWSSRPDNVSGINDKNYAATFHFYAVSHSLNDYKGFIESANNNGVTVFVTEWGTTKASGAETFGSKQSDEWLSYLDSKGISWCNWSVSNKSWNDDANSPEYSAAFMGQKNYDIPSNWQYSGYSESGKYVYDKLNASYTNAPWKNGTPAPSSSASVDPTSSAAVVAGSEIIDDFNDNNTGIEKLGPEAFWYLYTYGTASYDNVEKYSKDETYKYWDMVSGSASDYYALVKNIRVSASSGIGMEAQIPEGDLAKCRAISYKYKGAAHKFRASMSTVTPNKGYEHTSGKQPSSTVWKTVTVSPENLSQTGDLQAFDWSKVAKFSFIIDFTTSGEDLYIDDVTCIGELSGVVEVEDSDENSSSSVKPASSASVSSSSTVVPTSSAANPTSSAEVVVDNGLIDDFEDGNATSEFGEYEFYWYIYTAGGSVNNTYKTVSGQKNYDMVKSAGGNSYVAMTGISGVVSGAKTYPSVGMGFDVDGSALGECSAIQYDYKGSGHQFRATVDGLTMDEGYDHITSENPTFPATTNWETVIVYAKDLKQPTWIPSGEVKNFSWEKVIKVAWVVSEKLTTANIGTELDIDNVYCVKEGAITGSSSASVNPGSSASAGTSGVLDDFEDGDSQNNLGQYWYVYADEQGSKFKNEANSYGGYEVYFDADAANGSKGMVGVVGMTMGNKVGDVDPSINLEMPLNYNLIACSEISYDYRGASHNFKVGMIGEGKTGAITGFNQHKVAIPGSAEWTPAKISWSDLQQEPYWGKTVALDKTKIEKFAWEVKGTVTDFDYLYVDNVRCTGLVVSEANVIKSSSSGQPIIGNSSSSTYLPPYMGIAAAPAMNGLKVSVHGSELMISVAKAGLVKVQVFDMMGHVMDSHVENMASGSYAHSLAGLNKGVYVVRVQQGSAVQNIRMQVR